MRETLFNRISFRKFAGFSFEYAMPPYFTICRFRNGLVKADLDMIFFNLLNKYLELVGLITRDGIVGKITSANCADTKEIIPHTTIKST